MIDPIYFVFLDDQTLDVVSSAQRLSGAYEDIDVANGVYIFFNEKLQKMSPRNKSNPSANDLNPGPVEKDEFLIRLNKVAAVNPNKWFDTMDEVRSFAEEL